MKSTDDVTYPQYKIAGWKFSIGVDGQQPNAILANGHNKLPLTLFFDINIKKDAKGVFVPWTPPAGTTIDYYCVYDLLEYYSGTPLRQYGSKTWAWSPTSLYAYPMMCQDQKEGSQLDCGETRAGDAPGQPYHSRQALPFQTTFYIYHMFDAQVQDRILTIAPRVVFYPEGLREQSLPPWDGTSGSSDPEELSTIICANTPDSYAMDQGSVVLCMPDENNPIKVGASSVFHFYVTLKSGIPIQEIARSGERVDGLLASHVGPQGTTQAYLWMPGQKMGIVELAGAQSGDKENHFVHHPLELDDTRGLGITLVHTPVRRMRFRRSATCPRKFCSGMRKARRDPSIWLRTIRPK